VNDFEKVPVAPIITGIAYYYYYHHHHHQRNIRVNKAVKFMKLSS
jgi:hypothetical protein